MFKLLVQTTRSSIRSLKTPVVTQKCNYRQSIYEDEQEKPYYKNNKYSSNYKSSGTFSLRDFQYDNSHGETGTLHTRFIKYIALENCKYDLLTPQKIKYSDYFPMSNDLHNFTEALNKTPTDQLARLLVFAFTFKSNGDIRNVLHAINYIDSLCEKRIPDMSFDQILSTLYSMMFLMPKQIARSKFYKAAMPVLVKNFDPSFNKHAFVQVTFYLGLWKKTPESMDMMYDILQNHLLGYLDRLTKTDLAIVSNSAFRVSVLIENSTFLERLKADTLKTSMEEDAILVTFVKSLRLNRVKEKEVYDKLKTDLLDFDLEKLHFKGLVHFFAYFSDGLWNDKEVCNVILDGCLRRLLEFADEYVVNDIRAKDITTLLWSCANLDCQLDYEDLEFLENVVISKIRKFEFKYRSDELVECCLSLWMLGLRSSEILNEINSLDFSQFTNNNPSRAKLNSRLRLLLSCIEIEAPELLKRRLGKEKAFNESRSAPAYLLKSENLRIVKEFLDSHSLGIESTSFVCPIKDLNLAGILVNFDDNTTCFIEVVEEDLMLKFDNKISTLMSLKKRLLETLGHNVIVLTPSEYSTKDALEQHLTSHLQSLKVQPTSTEAEEIKVKV
ncbi:hypothetical protein ACFFRR_003843 [Megaselia abdita]